MPAVEICVESVESALAAEAGGADRIEVCSALAEGGLTPSLGLIRAVRRAVRLPVHVLLRPRPGDFVYSEAEMAILREDIVLAAEAGVNGVVFGILTAEGEIDESRTGALVAVAHPLSSTFHRAFDLTPDLELALEAVVRTGVDRVLTSGGEPTALQGSATLKRLVQQACSRIAVMAGGGVLPATVAELAGKTGISEVHAALRHRIPSTTIAPPRPVHLGDPLLKEQARTIVRAEDVRRLRKALFSVAPAPADSSASRPS
jgi:copper homeostasis protein